MQPISSLIRWTPFLLCFSINLSSNWYLYIIYSFLLSHLNLSFTELWLCVDVQLPLYCSGSVSLLSADSCFQREGSKKNYLLKLHSRQTQRTCHKVPSAHLSNIGKRRGQYRNGPSATFENWQYNIHTYFSLGLDSCAEQWRQVLNFSL